MARDLEACGIGEGRPLVAAAVDVSGRAINAIERERYDPSLELAVERTVPVDCRIEGLFAPTLDGGPRVAAGGTRSSSPNA